MARETLVNRDQAVSQRADFPNVKCWFKEEWFQIKTTLATSERIKGFVEMEDGNIVDDQRFDSIRKYARNIWDTLKGEGLAPQSWRMATEQVKERYRTMLCGSFPELRLCHRNWKADQVATLYYSPWYNYWVKNRIDNENSTKRGAKLVSQIALAYFYLFISCNYSNP